MKMEFEQFNEWIQAIRKLSKYADAIRSFGVDMDGMSDLIQSGMNPLFKTVFNEMQQNLLDWWLYDKPNGITGNPDPNSNFPLLRNTATKTPIPCHTERQLYDYLMTLEEA